METVKIQFGDSLKELAEKLRRNKYHLAKQISERLYSSGVTDGSLDDCGRSIGEIMESKEIDPGKCSTIILDSKNKWAHFLLGNIKVIHHHEDCPYCGYETENFSDGFYGNTWKERRCLKPDCDYRSSTEPKAREFDFEDRW